MFLLLKNSFKLLVFLNRKYFYRLVNIFQFVHICFDLIAQQSGSEKHNTYILSEFDMADQPNELSLIAKTSDSAFETSIGPHLFETPISNRYRI